MSASIHQKSEFDGMPTVRGKLEYDVPLARYTWFRTGGNADILFTPEDEQDLSSFLGGLPDKMPVFPLGVGSNLLVRDGGIEGVVIRFGKKFSDISIDGDLITAGAGAPDISVAHAAFDAGLSGLEFLRGIPGTIGGAIRMNAGAYGSEINDVFVSAKAVDRKGNIQCFEKADMGFSYRSAQVAQDYIFTSGTLKGTQATKTDIEKRMKDIVDAREESQPLRTRTGGSTFKNPAGQSAWKLIDGAGCRGLKIGGARVSEKHCNFLINEGDATAEDIEHLGEEVRRRVMNNSGVRLEWEIKRVGRRI